MIFSDVRLIEDVHQIGFLMFFVSECCRDLMEVSEERSVMVIMLAIRQSLRRC